MQDRPIMCVTQVTDDETGIWAGDICEFKYYGSIVESILKGYRQKGYDEIMSMLECLKDKVKEDWEKIEAQEEK